MNTQRLKLATVGAVVALLVTLAAGTAAQGAPVDRTPPTAPYIIYSQVFANGQFIGLLDRGTDSSAWRDLRLTQQGPNRVFVDAVDAAGNRSRSSTNTVTGFDCEL